MFYTVWLPFGSVPRGLDYACVWTSPDTMTCLWYWVLTTVSLVNFGLTATIDIGAIFDSDEYLGAQKVFHVAFNNIQFPPKHNVNISPRALSLGSDFYQSTLSICSFVQERDVKVLLVVGKQRTVQTVGQIAEPLGIPILGYTTDTVVDRFVQVSLLDISLSLTLSRIQHMLQTT